MAQVAVTIAGRVYRMACGEGEEEHLQGLARTLDKRIGTMRGQFGEIGDQRITIMAAITLADDLADAGKRIAALEADMAALRTAQSAQDARIDALGEALARRLDEATARLAAAADHLADGGQ